jgi:hypothetical protein
MPSSLPSPATQTSPRGEKIIPPVAYDEPSPPLQTYHIFDINTLADEKLTSVLSTDAYTIKAVGQEEFSDVKVPETPASSEKK